MAAQLKHVFGLDNTDIGILVAASSRIGALFTLPIGTLIDRLNRKMVLAAIALWTVVVVVSGMASSSRCC